MAIVPAKNRKALIAYYVSLLSFLPCLGFIPGLIALTLGIMGAKAAKRNPEIEGGGLAWFAIRLSGLMSFIWLSLIILFFALAAAGGLK